MVFVLLGCLEKMVMLRVYLDINVKVNFSLKYFITPCPHFRFLYTLIAHKDFSFWQGPMSQSFKLMSLQIMPPFLFRYFLIIEAL